MTPERHALIREVFLEAVAIREAERAAILDDRCGGDLKLREEVERLLAHHMATAAQETVAAEPVTGDSWRRGDPQLDLDDTRIDPVRVHVVDPTRAPRADYQPGDVVDDRYRIVALLGRGGMGEVYRAEDTHLNQNVALKFLARDLVNIGSWLDRFRREVRVARGITHRNVCRVFDIGETNGRPFITMEYVDGEDLASLIRRIGRLPREKALEIAHQVCAGLATAHAEGILHRDLKPANIMLDGAGQVRLTDFGLAVASQEIPKQELRAGTPAYMAPEQIRGEGVTTQSDIYALGLVLYELFAGRPAFEANSIREYAELHCKAEALAPSEYVDDIDADTERVILRCLEKDPQARPPGALAVAAGLPGGDPLAAALAAGTTPSPELIAEAAAELRVLRPQTAFTAIGIAVLLAVFLLSGGSVATRKAVQFEDPVVLVDRGRRALQEIFHVSEAADSAYGFCDANDARAHLAALYGGDQDTLATFGFQQQFLLWYRQNPERMVARSVENAVFDRGSITLTDPHSTGSGALTILMEGAGRVVLFTMQPHGPIPQVPAGAADFAPLFEIAGVDATRLEVTEFNLPLSIYADEQHAWVVTDPDAEDGPILIHAAALDGLPVFFSVTTSQRHREPGILKTAQQRESFTPQAFFWLLVGAIVVSLPIARRHLRTGRADRTGAYRMAVFAFAVRMLIWLLGARHGHSVETATMLFASALVAALAGAMVAWVLYLALEPWVRRYCPHVLLSWARLSRLHIRDRLVGWHTLLGVCFGVYFANLLWLDGTLAATFGLPVRTPVIKDDVFGPLAGLGSGLATGLDLLLDALLRGLLFSMLIVALRVWLKQSVWAWIVAAIVISALYVPLGSHPVTSALVIGIGGAGVATWVIARFGLLTVVVAIWISRLLSMFPVTLRPDEWYADVAWLPLVTVVALAAYGVWASLSVPVRRGTPMTSSLSGSTSL